MKLNRPGWEATGVINDIPPRLEPKSDETRREILKINLDQRQKIAEDLDHGKAAELALREILGTVRDAEHVDTP